MKIFLKKRASILLGFLLFLSAVQVALVFISLDPERGFFEVRSEVLTVMAVFFLVQFSITVLLIAQLPYYLRKYLRTINEIMSEVSSGNYNVDIDLEEYGKLRDKEMVEIVSSFNKMMDIILRFDNLKKQKIQEQRARLIALLNLTENGFIILNKKGDVVYVNYLTALYFPTIQESINMIDTHFRFDIDKNIQSYITKAIKEKNKLMPKNFYMQTLGRHINLKSEIVRDSNGDFDGMVIGIYNLDSKTDRVKKDNPEQDQQSPSKNESYL